MAITSTITKDPSYLLKRIQVLVVDNDNAIVDLLGSVLKKLGFGTVHSARDGFQAVEILRHQKVDLLITDWDLKAVTDGGELPGNSVIVSEQWSPTPPTNGALFLKFLRGSKYSPNPYLSVIMLTGVALKDNIAYARDSGVNEVLVKPVSAESLCNRIVMLVQNDRPFITADSYRGPCRRRKKEKLAHGHPDRRKNDIKLVKFGS